MLAFYVFGLVESLLLMRLLFLPHKSAIGWVMLLDVSISQSIYMIVQSNFGWFMSIMLNLLLNNLEFGLLIDFTKFRRLVNNHLSFAYECRAGSLWWFVLITWADSLLTRLSLLHVVSLHYRGNNFRGLLGRNDAFSAARTLLHRWCTLILGHFFRIARLFGVLRFVLRTLGSENWFVKTSFNFWRFNYFSVFIFYSINQLLLQIFSRNLPILLLFQIFMRLLLIQLLSFFRTLLIQLLLLCFIRLLLCKQCLSWTPIICDLF